MGFGWLNSAGTGNAEFTLTNGIEGSWTPDPVRWDNDYLKNLFALEWKRTTGPAGSLQWTPVDPDAPRTPDAHIEGRMNPLMMMTSDIALKVDPAYRQVCERFLADFDHFTTVFVTRLVQADPPRHGPQGALPRARRARRGPDLAGSDTAAATIR